MTLSSCHHYSLNNDCHWYCHGHCHCCCDCHCHYMQRIYVYFILSCLALPCLVLFYLELTSITIVIIGMTLYELVLHYHIISYLMFFNFISSADLISILFCSILFYFISNWLDSILFYLIEYVFIEFNLLHCSVLYLIFVSICPSVCLSVYLSE